MGSTLLGSLPAFGWIADRTPPARDPLDSRLPLAPARRLAFSLVMKQSCTSLESAAKFREEKASKAPFFLGIVGDRELVQQSPGQGALRRDTSEARPLFCRSLPAAQAAL